MYPEIIISCSSSSFSDGACPVEVGISCRTLTRTFFVRPLARWEDWNDMAEALNCVSRIELESTGTEARQVAAALNDAAGGRTVFCFSRHERLVIERLFCDSGELMEFPFYSLEETERPDLINRIRALVHGRFDTAGEDAAALLAAIPKALAFNPMFAA